MRFVFCAEIVNNEQTWFVYKNKWRFCIGELYTGEGEPYYLYWRTLNVLIKYKNSATKS